MEKGTSLGSTPQFSTTLLVLSSALSLLYDTPLLPLSTIFTPSSTALTSSAVFLYLSIWGLLHKTKAKIRFFGYTNGYRNKLDGFYR